MHVRYRQHSRSALFLDQFHEANSEHVLAISGLQSREKGTGHREALVLAFCMVRPNSESQAHRNETAYLRQVGVNTQNCRAKTNTRRPRPRFDRLTDCLTDRYAPTKTSIHCIIEVFEKRSRCGEKDPSAGTLSANIKLV